MANYSRRTMALLRDILSQKARSFDHSTAKIVAYWKTTLFDIGVQTDVIDAMSSHSFFWTNVIPSLSERKLEDRYGHFGPLPVWQVGKHWDDKPRWSPDGRVIYFLSERSGLFNVWGVHFDPGKGSPVGEAVPVTALENRNLMVPKSIEQVGLALTQDRLVVTVTQVSGSIC